MTLTQNNKFAKFGPKTEMRSNIYTIWHLEQIEHANYELELMILAQNYRFGQIWSQNWNMRNVYEFWHSELIGYINFVQVIWNSKLDPKFQIWADLVSHFKYNLIFMKVGIQSGKNTLIFKILFGIDDFAPNSGSTIEVLSDFMKFSTKKK